MAVVRAIENNLLVNNIFGNEVKRGKKGDQANIAR